jgi:FkbM family methyltransferase
VKLLDFLLRLLASSYRRVGAAYSGAFGRPPFWDASMNAVGRLMVRLLEQATGMKVPEDEYWGVPPRIRLLLRLYETDSVKVCQRMVRPGMNVLDIGAHCGYYTRLFSDIIGQSGTVYAFEADPETFDYLALNIRNCKNGNVKIVPAAVGDRSEVRELFIMSGTGKHSLFDTSQELHSFTVKNRIAVPMTSIDDFLQEHGNPEIGFIKMDIEGAEPLALA